jgi:hypothetical protein
MAVDKKTRRMVMKTAQFALAMRAALIPLMNSKAMTPEEREAISEAFKQSTDYLDELLRMADEPEQDG